MQRTFPVGQTRYVSGRVERFQDRPQLAHPERVLTPDAFETAPSFARLFAFGADHWFAAGIGRFSYVNGISGADAWTTAFVLMALTMVLTRIAVTALAILAARRGAAALPA